MSRNKFKGRDHISTFRQNNRKILGLRSRKCLITSILCSCENPSRGLEPIYDYALLFNNIFCISIYLDRGRDKAWNMVWRMEVMAISGRYCTARGHVYTRTIDNTRPIAQFVETCEFNDRTASAHRSQARENAMKNARRESVASGLQCMLRDSC